MPPGITKTRVVELIEDGRFDDILEEMARAILKRLRIKKARQERQDKNRRRREKAELERRARYKSNAQKKIRPRNKVM